VPEAPSPPSRLRLAVVLVGGAVIAGMWLFPSQLRALLTPEAAQATAAGCDIRAAPCTATFDDGAQVTLDVTPRGLPEGSALTFTITAPGPARAVEAAGTNMNMGLTQLPVVDNEAHGFLPSCTERMEWQLDVVLTDGRRALFFTDPAPGASGEDEGGGEG